ncbi:hypothetical protein VSDG_05459 [Cytospora chrysosperma]|uniref:UDP-N-acetylglucosamine transferase subunit ALG13 n=1 Tax=Cytospora chrysosperma TaxID=252740 RepID=A0A423VZK4_CYTCH|nr:hypothetical protein VSDG_05459 [Valsa sordida]
MAQHISGFIRIGHFNGERDILPSYHVDMDRHVMVTGGAVVPFKELLLEVTTPDFLSALHAHGFTHLHLQCNTFAGEMRKRLSEMDEKDLHSLKIDVVDFDKDLKENMLLLCRGEAGLKAAGVVIGHAGTGTIADACESEVALVIVANPNLMDNHQAVFAAEVAEEYDNIIQGHLGRVVETIPQVMGLIEQLQLDNLEPFDEPDFPVDPKDRINFIDQVIASGV